MKRNVPQYKVRDISELIGRELSVEAVGGTRIPYIGFVELSLKLGSKELAVPFLVTKESLIEPIIGYNVISMITKEERYDQTNMNRIVNQNLFPDLDKTQLNLLNTILSDDSEEFASVRCQKLGCVVPSGTILSIPCRMDAATNIQKTVPALFQPVLNHPFDDLQIHQ